MSKSGFFQNVFDAIASARTKRAEREVARFISTNAYRKLLNEERTTSGL